MLPSADGCYRVIRDTRANIETVRSRPIRKESSLLPEVALLVVHDVGPGIVSVVGTIRMPRGLSSPVSRQQRYGVTGSLAG